MNLFFLLLVCLLSSCSPDLKPVSKVRVELAVVKITPTSNQVVKEPLHIEVTFSEPVDEKTIHEKTFLVVPSSNLPSLNDPDKWLSDIEKNKIVSIKGQYEMDDDQTTIQWIPLQKMDPFVEYQIILTPTIQTPLKIPLNSGVQPFVSCFIFEGQFDSQNTHQNEAPLPSEEVPKTFEEPVLEVPEPILPPMIEEVHFTEIVSDPQRDWNDSAGGNQILFDALFGTGTVGSTDEWIEIKNGRSQNVNLTGWTLHMVDGTNEIENFIESKAVFNFSENGSLDHFNPDEFLVIGNPKGDMKNTLQLLLYDETNQLVDEVAIDDANASSVDDESYQLREDFLWQQTNSTPGF